MRKNFIVLIGQSGSGKDYLISQVPNSKKMLTYTTREKRDGEIDGVSYCFISKEEFLKKKLNDAIELNGNYYGSDITIEEINNNFSENIEYLFLIKTPKIFNREEFVKLFIDLDNSTDISFSIVFLERNILTIGRKLYEILSKESLDYYYKELRTKFKNVHWIINDDNTLCNKFFTVCKN